MYIYDGEFNAPMNGPAVECHLPVLTEGKMLVMDKAEEEPLPFTDPPPPEWEFFDPLAEWEPDEREDEY